MVHLRSVFRLLVVLSTFGPGATISGLVPFAQAQLRTVPREVVFSASGGVSKGAYQGGVDWAISEFLRRQRVPELRDTLLLDHRTEFVLKSATGASAGNVNALFVALGWCTQEMAPAPWREPARQTRREHPAEIAAEDSLFWQAWVPTGLPELSHRWDQSGIQTPPPLPPRESEAGAFSRQLFHAAHKPAVHDFMLRATPYRADGQSEAAPCSLPVGLTLTKLIPVDVALRDRVGSASVQRFASVFRVIHTGAQLDFGPAGELKTKASLGALASLPGLENQARVSFGDRLDDVFDIVLASSSFPLAFAPRDICYEPGGLIEWHDGEQPPCDAFADGGVFDNNPIGLAYRLNELVAAPPHRSTVNVVYSSPGNFRDPLQRIRQTKANEEDQRGIGAAAQLLTGAFQAARDYELQAFARTIARDTEQENARRDPTRPGFRPEDAVQLRLSSRSMPIFGETLSSFGAFLGRPMREYDFYAGVYDGLEFVARHFICAIERDAALETCAANKHGALIETDAFHLSPTGDMIVRWMLAREHTKRAVDPEPQRDDKRYLLWRLHDALAATLTDVQEPCAARADVVKSAICRGGMEAPLRRLADDRRAVVSAARQLRDDCALISMQLRHCFSDDGFVDFLKHPEHHVYEEADRLLSAIDVAEGLVRRTTPAAPRYELPLSAGSALFNGDTMRYRRGLAINQSTARRLWNHKIATAASFVLPNYVQRVWTWHGGKEATVLGWKPVVWTFGSGLYLSSATEWSFEDRRRDAWTWSASLGEYVHWKGTVSSWEVGYGFLQPTRRTTRTDDSGARLRLSVRALGEKLQLTTWVLPSGDGRWRRTLGVGLGVSDVNGVVHWLLRLGT